VSRRLFDWYYFRLYITVVPETVTLLDPLPDSRTRPSRGASGEQARALRGYDSVVLTSIDHDGRPSSRRVRAEARDGALHLDGAAAARPGPASLLAHRHDEQTWHLRSVGAAGTLAVDDAGRATFTTGRLLPGASASPRAALRMIRQCRATTERYLDRRGLARPTVPWAAYRELYHS
jgi:hypothetical protein